MASEQPLIVIVGPTASGKSELALKVASKFNGEIICADSRTIYKGMDIGTAKPSKKDQKNIKHHLLDQVEPGEPFTAYDFQRRAKAAIKAIRSRQKLPLLVGGTGLYIDSIVFDYQFLPKKRMSDKFAKLDIKELQEYCKKNKITLPNNKDNKRHLLTAVAQKNNKPARSTTPINNTIIVGITTNKEDLSKRITKRAEWIFSHGIIEEARRLGNIYGWDSEAMTANIYPLIRKLEKNELSLEEAVDKSVTLDKRLAKRQLTWFKRNPFISWRSLTEAEHFLFDLLAKIEQK